MKEENVLIVMMNPIDQHPEAPEVAKDPIQVERKARRVRKEKEKEEKVKERKHRLALLEVKLPVISTYVPHAKTEKDVSSNTTLPN